jgi:hypothetical protein
VQSWGPCKVLLAGAGSWLCGFYENSGYFHIFMDLNSSVSSHSPLADRGYALLPTSNGTVLPVAWSRDAFTGVGRPGHEDISEDLALPPRLRQ